jgi:hypothetical protein
MPACFAALFGAADNGHWLIDPKDSPLGMSRRSRPGTMILETKFQLEAMVHHSKYAGRTSATGQMRRLSCLGTSASPPTSDVSLRRSELTLRAKSRSRVARTIRPSGSSGIRF